MTRRTLNRISLALLATGFTAALVVYFLAAEPSADALRDDPLNRRKYVHEMRVIGGSANLLMADFQDWFEDQWHDEALARSIAVLAVFTTLGFRFFATLPSGNRKQEERKE